MAIKIVVLPLNRVIFHSFLYVYQRFPWVAPWVPGDAEGPAKSDDQRTNRHAALKGKSDEVELLWPLWTCEEKNRKDAEQLQFTI
jgi:hypothetical protein